MKDIKIKPAMCKTIYNGIEYRKYSPNPEQMYYKDGAMFIQTAIHVADKNNHYCGQPNITIAAWKCMAQIEIAIRDEDDYVWGCAYYLYDFEFDSALAELHNWLLDITQGVIDYNKIIEDDISFFPDLNCPREAICV